MGWREDYGVPPPVGSHTLGANCCRPSPTTPTTAPTTFPDQIFVSVDQKLVGSHTLTPNCQPSYYCYYLTASMTKFFFVNTYIRNSASATSTDTTFPFQLD